MNQLSKMDCLMVTGGENFYAGVGGAFSTGIAMFAVPATIHYMAGVDIDDVAPVALVVMEMSAMLIGGAIGAGIGHCFDKE